MYNFDSYNVLLVIATNIPVLLMTAFVLQGHIYTAVQKFGIRVSSAQGFIYLIKNTEKTVILWNIIII